MKSPWLNSALTILIAMGIIAMHLRSVTKIAFGAVLGSLGLGDPTWAAGRTPIGETPDGSWEDAGRAGFIA